MAMSTYTLVITIHPRITFSPLAIETLRGADWRGRDCDDSDVLIYPGTRIQASDVTSHSGTDF
jgi:hypothetical protein